MESDLWWSWFGYGTKKLLHFLLSCSYRQPCPNGLPGWAGLRFVFRDDPIPQLSSPQISSDIRQVGRKEVAF